MKRGPLSLLIAVCLVASAVAQSSPAMRGLQRDLARVSSPLNLPDAPLPATDIEPAYGGGPVRGTNEILKDDPYTPLTKQEKWKHFLNRTHASATFIGVAENTIFNRATGSFIYCCGIGSWGEQYAASLADTESRQFFGNFLFPTLLRQDPRYFPKRTGNMWGRAWYAASRVVVTRNDSGHDAINYSEFLGVALSKALSNAYYPDRQRGMWNTSANILGTFQSDATTNLVREFWPDIRKIVHKHTPQRLRSLEERLPLPDAPAQY